MELIEELLQVLMVEHAIGVMAGIIMYQLLVDVVQDIIIMQLKKNVYLVLNHVLDVVIRILA